MAAQQLKNRTSRQRRAVLAELPVPADLVASAGEATGNRAALETGDEGVSLTMVMRVRVVRDGDES